MMGWEKKKKGRLAVVTKQLDMDQPSSSVRLTNQTTPIAAKSRRGGAPPIAKSNPDARLTYYYRLEGILRFGYLLGKVR
jgi:hypothetical protein